MSEVKFERENRYIVIKRSDLDKLYEDPTKYATTFGHALSLIAPHLPKRKFLVIESDWPEYEPVWKMIERRVTGNDIPAAETMGYSVAGNRYMIALTQQEILDHSQSYAGCMFELVARSDFDAQRLLADTAEAERAALREELAEANRQIQLRDELGCMTCGGDGHVHRIDGEYLGPCTSCLAYEFASAKRSLTAAEQRNAELERDAARYRWLRDPSPRDCAPEFDVICGVAEGEDVLWSADLDRTIDAALNPTESGASE